MFRRQMWTRKGDNTGFWTILETVAGLQRNFVDIIPGRDHIAKDVESAAAACWAAGREEVNMSDGKTGLQLRSLLKKSGELEISLASVPTPEPAEDEVVVRVEATPINPSDLGLLI